MQVINKKYTGEQTDLLFITESSSLLDDIFLNESLLSYDFLEINLLTALLDKLNGEIFLCKE